MRNSSYFAADVREWARMRGNPLPVLLPRASA
jgi:hypothetical protein